jgi:hypothetical protein
MQLSLFLKTAMIQENKRSWAWCSMPIIPALCEAKAKGSQVPGQPELYSETVSQRKRDRQVDKRRTRNICHNVIILLKRKKKQPN